MKTAVWLGMFIGPGLGNLAPELWGGEALSMAGVAGAFVGGMLGIALGYRVGKSL